MSDWYQVVTTTAEKADAEKIAAALVQQRLAGCVQIAGPIQSHYRWQGKIETAQEWICTIKTRRDLYEQVEAAIVQMHPYDEPEILATLLAEGSPGYLQWLDAELKQP